ncbi:MAG: hypothetical protein PHE78_07555 [Candidatus Gastranaerophilales bacterium]|nr:hypothetical protein [Candidatus Gastranaerophilales bacterium]
MKVLPLAVYQPYQQPNTNNRNKRMQTPHKNFNPAFKSNPTQKEAQKLYTKYQDLFDFLVSGPKQVKENFDEIVSYAQDSAAAKKLQNIITKHANGEEYSKNLTYDISSIKTAENVPMLGELLKLNIDTRSKIYAIDKIGNLGEKKHIDLIKPLESSIENYYSHTDTEYFHGSMGEMYPEGNTYDVYENIGEHVKKAIGKLALKD